MAKYYRRRSRTPRRRYFRATRLRKTYRRPGTKRFFRRQRRNAKPEIKFANNIIGNIAIPASGATTVGLIQTNFPNGTGRNQRVGAELKFQKLFVHFAFSQDTAVSTGVNATTALPESLFRVLIWTPRIDFETARSNMELLPWSVPADFNMVTIHLDQTRKVGYPTITGTSTVNFPFSPSVSNIAMLKKWLPYPKNVRFGPTLSTIDDERDQVYMTVYNTNPAQVMEFNGSTRIHYIDP